MKKLISLFIIIMIMLPTTAMAHSTLEEATPAQQAILDTSPPSISMSFSTKIESLSNFKLFNSKNEEVAIDNLKVDGAVLSGSVSDTLPNDEYTVKWSIIGADGHAIKGEYIFEVKAAEATPAEESTEPVTTSNTDAVENEEEAPTTNDAADAVEKENELESVNNTSEETTEVPVAEEKKSNSMIFIIGAVIVIVIIGLVIGARRKK
ncbi:copper resistance protein CopC [Paenibacillus yanchengensis]|uniref:Copper resistance protein CopC n=1 Tax=Paenibacillus yanchengensis TaxID=2035833 RepID=A0ABW4YL91_9BACL